MPFTYELALSLVLERAIAVILFRVPVFGVAVFLREYPPEHRLSPAIRARFPRQEKNESLRERLTLKGPPVFFL
jgi:hypothetical protein